MDNAELLSHFENRVDEFEKIQGFIEKAKSQASKFATVVVEKVIRTNTEKAEGIVEELIPLMIDMDGVVETLEAKKAEIVEGQQQSRLALEELELRLLIQELTEEAFESDASGLKTSLSETDEKIAELDAELDKFRVQLDRWQEYGERAGVLESGDAATPDDDDDDVSLLSIEFEAEDLLNMRLAAAEAEVGTSDEAEAEEPEAEELEAEELEAEEEVLEAEEFEAEEEVLEAEELEAEEEVLEAEEFEADQEVLEAVEFDDANDNVEFEDFEASDQEAAADGGMHIEKVSVSEDLSHVFGDTEASDEIAVEDADSDDKIEIEMGEARQAVLIYSEGNSDEQVYPLNDNAIRLGRGRDNDIQVKNDSKVSRYHCRLHATEDKFFVEDNKSANGTMVDNEPVTGERQVFGGENVTIGETDFRFRIMG